MKGSGVESPRRLLGADGSPQTRGRPSRSNPSPSRSGHAVGRDPAGPPQRPPQHDHDQPIDQEHDPQRPIAQSAESGSSAAIRAPRTREITPLIAARPALARPRCSTVAIELDQAAEDEPHRDPLPRIDGGSGGRPSSSVNAADAQPDPSRRGASGARSRASRGVVARQRAALARPARVRRARCRSAAAR
jgi:hypothetical protein